MQIQLRKPNSLTEAELATWRQIIAASDEFSSPYFHPQFTLDVAAVRNDVEVAVVAGNSTPAGFFPFQRSGDKARPVGGNLSDAHGLIHDGSFDWNWPDLLHACGLSAWEFHYQIETQVPDEKWQADVEPAAVMNLDGGFDEFASRLESKSVIKQSDRKARKLEREHGHVRFEWDTDDDAAFEILRKWKSKQYRDSNIADVFSFDWTLELLRRIRQQSGHDYEGLMSVLYVDDRPSAVHFGLRSGRVLHQWFPAYDPELKLYSPGIIHMLELARHAAENGVSRIDLGRTCHYKSRIATDFVNVAEGCIDLRPVRRMLKHGYQQTFEWLRRSPLRAVARIPGRMLRQLAERRQFQ